MEFGKQNYGRELETVYKAYSQTMATDDRSDEVLGEIECALKRIKTEINTEKENHIAKIIRIVNWLTDYKGQDEKLFNRKSNTLNSIFAVLIGSVLFVELLFPNPATLYLCLSAGIIGLTATVIMMGKKMLFKSYGSKLEEIVGINTQVRNLEAELDKINSHLSEVNWVVTSKNEESQP